MLPPALTRAVNRSLGKRALHERRDRFTYRDAGHGYDRFGLQPDYVALGDLVTTPLYESWFRVQSTGAEHIPDSGAAILAANHSGTLPFDAMMLWADVYRNSEPTRVARAVADYFVPSLPLIGAFFARTGMVGGSRGNVRALLESGELLLLFPEGTPGIGKPFHRRYQLERWRPGHAELAIRFGVPVVPVAVVGAEEQMPALVRLPGVGKVPWIPIPLTPVPLPVRYHVLYGEPIPLHERHSPEQADDPTIVAAAAEEVRLAVRTLLDQGLSERDGVFG